MIYEWTPEEWEAFLKAESDALDDFEARRQAEYDVLEADE